MKNPQIGRFHVLQGGETRHFVILQVEEHVDDVVYQENMFWSIILGHICR